MPEATSERRFRIYSLTAREIIALFNWRGWDFVRLPKLKDLPEDYSVIDVHHDWQRDAFLLRISHPSFDVVPEGGKIPISGPLEYETIDFQRLQEVAANIDER